MTRRRALWSQWSSHGIQPDSGGDYAGRRRAISTTQWAALSCHDAIVVQTGNVQSCTAICEWIIGGEGTRWSIVFCICDAVVVLHPCGVYRLLLGLILSFVSFKSICMQSLWHILCLVQLRAVKALSCVDLPLTQRPVWVNQLCGANRTGMRQAPHMSWCVVTPPCRYWLSSLPLLLRYSFPLFSRL